MFQYDNWLYLPEKAILRHRDNTDIVNLEMMVNIRYWWQNSKLGDALLSAWCYWKERMGMTMNNVTKISNSSSYFVATFVTNIDVVSSWCHERENHLKRKTRLKDTGCTLFRYICKNQPTQALFIRLVSDDSIWYHYLISLSVKKDHFGSYRLAVIEKY